MKKWILMLILLFLVSCDYNNFHSPEPTPPGWNELVSNLLVDSTSFPSGWEKIRDSKDILVDTSVNHVYRSWWWKSRGDGLVEQSIWRAINTTEAEEKYNDLRQGSFLEKITPKPGEENEKYLVPDEITYRSEIANSFYYACGWKNGGECIVIAQYRNYVSYMRLSLNGQNQGYTTIGLSYQEIESLIQAMDEKFAEFLASHPLETPVP
jgi:hypothetical protein